MMTTTTTDTNFLHFAPGLPLWPHHGDRDGHGPLHGLVHVDDGGCAAAPDFAVENAAALVHQ